MKIACFARRVALAGAFCGVAGAQVTQRDYTYDAQGNRLSATNQARFRSAGAFSIEPRRALPNDLVNIYGRNFPFVNPGSVAVTVGGQAASVSAVAANVITFTMPSVLVGGAVLVTIGAGQPLHAGDILLEGITITPAQVEVAYGEQVQFTATVSGGATQNVTWKVNNIAAGNATVGAITPTGLYTAPAGSATVEFPILVSATSSRIDLTSYAVVKTECSASTPLVDDAFANGTLTAAYERDCYTFSGTQGQYAYIAYIGGPTAKSLKLRNSDGVLISSALNGAALKLGDVLLPATDTYRVEIEAGASGTGAYQVWFDAHVQLPQGVWLHPVSDVWHDARCWSRSLLPAENVPVSIPDKPGSITITVSSGTQKCASIDSQEGLRLQAGTLEVNGDAKISATFTLAGGTLAKARVVAGNGGELLQLTTSGGVLDAVTLASNVIGSTNGSYMTLRNGLTLAGGNVVMSGSNCYFYFNGTQAIGGTGEIQLTGSGSAVYSFANNMTLTFGRSITVRGRGVIDADYYTSSSFVNQGTIRADQSGQSLTLQGANWQNFGTLDAINGSILTLSASWSNAATISEASSTVNLGGSFSFSGLGTIVRSGGSINLTGTLTNTGHTLPFDATTGSWNLQGGTVLGGTIQGIGGNGLTATTSGGTLQGVTLASEFDVSTPSAGATIRNGLTLQSGASVAMSGTSSYLYLDGTQTVGGTGEIAMTGSSPNLYPYPTSTATVTFGAGITIHGRGTLHGDYYAGTSFVNQGVIRSDLAGQVLTVRRIQNSGKLDAINGSVLTLASNWSNAGTISEASSTINLGGLFSFSGLGTIVRSGGTINLTGTLSNTGRTLAFDGSTGSWNLLGGSVVGGTIQGSGGNGLTVTSSGGTLDGVTLASDLDMSASSAGVTIRNGLTLQNNASVVMSGTSSYLYIDGTQTVGGAGEIAMTGSSVNLYPYPTSTATVTFGLGITIHGRGTLHGDYYATTSFVNQGVIRSDVSGQTLTVRRTHNSGTIEALNTGHLTLDGSGWTNSNTIQAAAGSNVTLQGSGWTNSGSTTVNGPTLTMGGSWTQSGTITANNTLVNLGGTFTLAGLGTFAVSGGPIRLTGTLNNTTLDLTQSTVPWELYGGTIVGGTVVGSPTAMLKATSSGGVLNGVTLASDLDMSASSAGVTIRNGLTLQNNASVVMSGTSSYLYIDGTQTVGGAGEIAMTGSSVNLYPYPTSTATVTFGLGITIHGRGTLHGDYYATTSFVNQGVIRSDVSGQTLTVRRTHNSGTIEALNMGHLTLDGSGWMNSNTIQAAAGSNVTLQGSGWTNSGSTTVNGPTLTMGGSWTQSGTITANNTLVNLGGTFTLAGLGTFAVSGGPIRLTGTLNNTTLDLTQSTVPWELYGGTIVGGTVAGSPTAMLKATSSGGVLNGVTLASDLDMSASSAGVTIRNGLTLQNNASVVMSGTSSYLYIDGTQTVGGAGEIAMTGSSVNLYPYPTSTATVTFGLGITIHGRGTLHGDYYATTSFVNQGVIRSDVSGQTLTVRRTHNSGTIEALNMGHLTLDGSGWMNSNTIQAAAGSNVTLQGSGWTNSGSTTVNGPTLTMGGSWTQSGTITANNTLVNLGGTFTLAGLGTFAVSGGPIRLTGTLNNTTLDLTQSTVPWELYGGTIVGGTVVGSPTAMLKATSSGGVLNGVTLASDLDMSASSAGVTIRNGLTLQNNASVVMSGTSSYLYIDGTQTVGGAGEIAMTGSSVNLYPYPTSTATVTFGLGITIHGRGTLHGDYYATTSFVNQGVIRSNLNGQTLTVRKTANEGTQHATGGGLISLVGAPTNTGTVQVDSASTVTATTAYTQAGASALTLLNGGSIAANAGMTLQRGVLQGVGTITGNVTNNGGSVQPGTSAGALTITGTYTQNAGGSLDIEIGGTTYPGQYDRLVINGAFARGGTLNVSTINGFAPMLAQSFTIASHSSASGTFATVNSCIGGGLGFTPGYTATTTTLDVTAAPCP